MTLSGWIFMLLSWGVILGMFFYCMFRTLRKEDDGGITADEQGEQSAES
jgi:heme/copper-type cytochrome/quinol oxidase subunit 2